ncbi:MAG: phosphoadenylyl-sulfate reductase [Thermoleophilia bacterium]
MSELHGRGDAELATRQNVQLHWLELVSLPDVLDRLDAAGLSTAGGCGDTVRNITGCPVQGLAHDELFDCSDVVREAAELFYGNPAYTDLPRKHKITISACAHQCNAPEINCIALVGAIVDGREGFTVRVGGGLSSVPRIARDMGVFVPREQAIPVLRAILDAWKTDLRYRVSRVKARLKFMVDDIGPEGVRERVEALLGHPLERYAAPELPPPVDHMGINPQKQPGLAYLGVPVHLGLISAGQLAAIADLAEAVGGDVRVTRQQNLVVANVPDGEVERVAAGLAEIGHPVDQGPLRAKGVACTGEPHCNFSVTETKARLGRLIDHVEARFGDAAADLRLQLDGCPHACGQHWIADIGFQGTTARDDDGAGRRTTPSSAAASARAPRSADRCSAACRPRSSTAWSTASCPAGSSAGATARASRLRAPADRRGARRARGRRARALPRSRGGVRMSVELIDELEAGELSVEFEGEEPQAVIAWAIERFSPRLAISTALQLDGVAILDMAYEIDPSIRVFTVDTGRLPLETHELIEQLRDRYPGLRLDVLAPERRHVEALVARHGPDLFRDSVERRLLCCNVRKVQPLTRHLTGLDAWITGLRRDQWATRTNIRKVEIDHDHGAIVKLNPLAEWTEDEVRDYVRERGVPTHPLYAKGYTSIGCAPCTRPTREGEPARAGRWWWESNAPKECGIHCAIETGGFEHELHAILGAEHDERD